MKALTAAKLSRMGMLLSLALILHVVEGLLPSPGLPGAKLGLSNVVSLIALSVWGPREGLLLLVLRVTIGSVFGGTLLAPAFWLSLSGGVTSVLVMWLALRSRLSLVTVSLAGAAAHNLGQLGAAWLLTSQPGVFYYLPFLLWFALPSGLAVGIIGSRCLPALGGRSPGRSWSSREAAVAGSLLVLGGLLLTGMFSGGDRGTVASVFVDGRKTVQLALDRDQDYHLDLEDGEMHLEVRDGKVRVVSSTCPDKICVKTGAIGQAGRSIVCVPYRVAITIEGEADYDGVIQ